MKLNGELGVVKEILNLANDSDREEIFRELDLENEKINDYLAKCLRNDLLRKESDSKTIYEVTRRGHDYLENLADLEQLVGHNKSGCS